MARFDGAVVETFVESADLDSGEVCFQVIKAHEERAIVLIGPSALLLQLGCPIEGVAIAPIT